MNEKLEYSDIHISEEQDHVDIEETVEVIEVYSVQDYEVDSESAFPALGEKNDGLRHQLLNGRELPDQHPITAITGLREELDTIESLKTIYSNKKNQADYYLWEDGNQFQEVRTGHFVTLHEDSNTIKICTEADEIFGVIVEDAAFVGGQSDITRDHTYGLVAYSGLVAVECELPVDVNDYVVSNNYGYAKRSPYNHGYKVVALEDVDNNTVRAVILLNVSAEQVHSLSADVNRLDDQLRRTANNVTSAMNLANQAYNKAGETANISEEAIKSALEALKKSEDVEGEMDAFLGETAPKINETAVLAQSIAESAVVSAEAIRDEADKTAKEATASVNSLIKDLEPITTWTHTDAATGEQFKGTSYFVNHIENDLATKTEVETAESRMTDAMSAISQNAEKIRSIVSSVDKYSVGEYSQAYGLTHEQAKSILKKGMIYIPTEPHIEEYEGQGQENVFSKYNYYVWNGDDWEEHSGLVAFSSEKLIPSDQVQYWYVDSNEAPEGYEAYALYIANGDDWVQVNTLAGNVNNRITSMIRQTANKIAMDVADAQNNITSHQQWLDDNSANIQNVVSWKSDFENDVSQIATIKQTADEAGAGIALVVEEKDGKKVVNGASLALAINSQTGDSVVKLNANVVDIDAKDISLKGQTINISADGVLGIKSEYFEVSQAGELTATGGTIGSWSIDSDRIYAVDPGNSKTYVNIWSPTGKGWETDPENADEWFKDGSFINLAVNGDHVFNVTTHGYLHAKKAIIEGKITANDGRIGGWDVNSAFLGKVDNKGYGVGLWSAAVGSYTETEVFAIGEINGLTDSSNWKDAKFRVTNKGKLYASDVEIEGNITASEGYIGNWKISNGVLSLRNTLLSPYNFQMSQGNDSFIIKYNDGSNGLDMSMAAGGSSIALSSAGGGVIHGNWRFVDSSGREITLEDIIGYVLT